jgi:spore coat protein SA
MIYHLLDEREPFSEHDGGAISRWAANVLRHGDEVVVCPSYDSSWGFPKERLLKLPRWDFKGVIHPLIYRHRIPWGFQRIVYSGVFQPLMAILKPGDVLYVHNRPQYAAVLAEVAEGIRVVLHMHNSHLIRSNKGQLAALRNVPIVYCSDFLRREAETVFPRFFQTTRIVYNGADGKLFRAAARKRKGIPTIIFTGRLQPYKGAHILIQAMRILEGKGVQARCIIVGSSGFGRSKETRYTRRLRQTAAKNTEMLGYKSGASFASLLAESDIFCAPSIFSDPFPLAPLEAMAVGLPVVASNVGGLPEELAFGGGILVPANDPRALANSLETLILNKELRRRISSDANEAFMGHFQWSHVRAQYEQLIGSICL